MMRVLDGGVGFESGGRLDISSESVGREARLETEAEEERDGGDVVMVVVVVVVVVVVIWSVIFAISGRRPKLTDRYRDCRD